MDFNQILLFAGLGLLALVILFALWGFLAGLKRELKCTVVFLVLLVLAWLVFGNSGILLNINGGIVNAIRGILNMEESADATLWETIVEYLKSMEGLNLAPLLVDGKETYNLIYNICSAVATFVLLLGATLVVIIITPIIRLITHIIGLIIRGVKKGKARRRAAAGLTAPVKVEEKDEEAEDAVLVLQGSERTNDAVVTLSENELPPKKKTKKRIWGAVVGALKCVFLLIVLFAPISGIYSILKTVTPETRGLISDLVDGGGNEQTVASETGATDMVFELIDDYGKSGLGKFIEGSSYFFGNSFSTFLFDSMANITTERQHIKLREELIVYIRAVNELNGNIEVGTWTDEEVSRALDVLKESKLLPEIMPVAIEYASEIEFLKTALENASQEANFLRLRNIDWDKDIETILDTVKEAYKLDLFPMSELNFLTLDADVLAKTLSKLGETEFINQVFPIIIRTGVKLDMVKNLIGEFDQKLNIDEVDWQKELVSLAQIYGIFQKYGYTDLSEITGSEMSVLAKHLVVDCFDSTVNILDKLIEMSLFSRVIIPVGQAGLDHFLSSDDSEFKEFSDIINLTSITQDEWKEDFKSIVEIGKLAILQLNALSLEIKQMDLTSDESIKAIQQIVEKVFTLNILGDDQTKNDLLLAAFKKFELFDEADLFYTEYGTGERKSILDNVNWTDTYDGDKLNIGEIHTIQNIIGFVGQLAKLDSVDATEFKVDVEALLNDDVAVDILVSILEELVDSELTMQLVNPAVNKYVLPITDQYDDDDLIKDIFNEIGPGTAVEEIIKIVQAFKSAQNLGLFKVSKDGLKALEYQKVDDIKNIINTIFESKLFEGYEGRIIRIILKTTKLLDVEKGLLNDIDYTGEKEILISFIDEVTPILQDEEFKLVDENGGINLDIDYILQPDNFKHIMKGLELIIGTYELSEDGSFVEKDGSNLIVTLLPNIYDKYGKELVPSDFTELVELLDIDNLTGEQLASDIRRFVFIAGQLVEMDIQTLLVGGSITYTDKLQNIYNIIDALLGIEMIKPKDDEIFAWAINYLGTKLEGTIKLDKVTPEQFKDIRWLEEGEIAKSVVKNIIKFLEDNELTSTKELIDFVENEKYLETSFVTEANANAVIDILRGLLQLKTLECLSPVFFQAVINQVVESGTIEDFWNGNITGSQLMEDVRSILTIVEVAVNELDIIGLWKDEFKGNINLPSATSVNKIIDTLFNMNLVKGYEATLIKFAVDKVLPNNFPIDIKSIDFTEITDWDVESQMIQVIVTNALEVLATNGFVTVKDVMDFDYSDTSALKEFATSETTLNLASIIDAISTSQLVGKVLVLGFDFAVDKATESLGMNLEFLKDLTDVELLEDLGKLSNILRSAAEHSEVYNLLYPNTTLYNETKVSELLEIVKDALTTVGELNILNKHVEELLSTGINFAIGKVSVLSGLSVTAEDFKDVDLSSDFAHLNAIIDLAYAILSDSNAVTIESALGFKDDVLEDVTILINNSNVTNVANILKEIAKISIVSSLLPKALDFGIDKVVEMGYDISFVKNVELTSEQLANDIIRIANIIIDVINLHAIDIYNDETVMHGFDEKYVSDIVEQLSQINIIRQARNEWAAFIINLALDKANIGLEKEYKAADFEAVNWNQTKVNVQAGLVNIVKAVETLFFTEGVSIENIKDFIENEKYLQDGVITDEVVEYAALGLSKILSIDLLNVVLPDALEFGFDKVEGLNIGLLKNVTIDKENFKIDEVDLNINASDLGNIIEKLGDVVKAAVKFGAIEYLRTEDITNIDLEILGDALKALSEISVFERQAGKWLTLFANFASRMFNANISFEEADFGDVNVAQSVEKLTEMLSGFNKVLGDLGLTSVSAILDLVKTLNTEELITRENINSVITDAIDAIQPVFEIEYLQAVLPKLAKYGLELVPVQFYLVFVEKAINSDEYTGEMMASDINGLLDIVKSVVNLNVIEIVREMLGYDYTPIARINGSDLEEIVDEFAGLHIVKEFRGDILAYIVNTGLELANIDLGKGYDAKDFEGIDWSADKASAKQAVSSLAEVLNEALSTGISKANITELLDKINAKDYSIVTESIIRNALSFVEHIVEMNMIGVILPDALKFGFDKLESLNIGLLKNVTIDKENFKIDEVDLNITSKDLGNIVNKLADVVVALYNFGAIEYLETKDITNIDLEILGDALKALSEISVFERQAGNWLALVTNIVLDMIGADINAETADFGDVNVAQAIEKLTEVLARGNETLEILEISSITDAKDLLNKVMSAPLDEALAMLEIDGFAKSLTSMIRPLAEIEVLQTVLPKIANYGLRYIGAIKFLRDTINEGTITGEMLSADILAILDIVDIVIDAGAVDIYKSVMEKDFEIEIPFDALVNVINKIETLNVLRFNYSDWAVYISNWAAYLLRFDRRASIEDFAYMTNDKWAADFDALRDIIRDIESLINDNNFDTVQDILDFVNNKDYLENKAQYLHSDNAYAIIDIIEKVFGFNVLDIVLTKVASYTLEKMVNNNTLPDIQFIIDAIHRNEYVGKDMKEDVHTLLDLIRSVVEFGALDYLCFGNIEVINLEGLANAISNLENLNAYNIDKAKVLTLIINTGIKVGGLSIDEFDELTTEQSDGLFTSLGVVIRDLGEVLENFHFVSTNDIADFINNKEYMNGNYYNEATLNSITLTLNDLTNIKLLEAVLPKVAKFGIEQVNISGLEFLKDALTNELFSGAELVSDIKTVISILQNLIDFGVSDIIFNIKLPTINSIYLENIVDAIYNLNVYMKLKADWLGYGLGMALNVLNITVDADDFKDILSDQEAFKDVIRNACSLVESLDIRSMTSASNFLSNKDYLDESIYSDTNFGYIQNVLTQLISTNIVKAIFPKLLDYAINTAKNMNIDVSFINDSYTNVDLAGSDIPALINIVKYALDFGALQYLNEKDITDIDVEYIKSIIAEIENIKLFTLYRAEWLALGLNYVTPMMNFEVTANTFSSFTEADWAHDNMILQTIVGLIGEILDNNNLTSYKEILSYVQNDLRNELLTEKIINDKNIDTLGNVLTNALSLKVLETLFPDVLSFGIEKVSTMGIDISFLDGKLTTEILRNDVDNIINIVKAVLDFGALEIYNTKKIDKIDLSYVVKVLEEIDALETLNLARADWFALGINKAFTLLGVDDEVTVDELNMLEIDNDIKVLIDVVRGVDTVLKDLHLETYGDILDFINNKEYMKSEKITDKVLTDVVDIVDSLINLSLLKVVLPILAEWGMDKVAIEKLEFLSDAFTNHMFTGEEMVSDLRTVVRILRDLVDFGVADIITDTKLATIESSYLEDVIKAIDDINIFNRLRAEWMGFGFGMLSNMIGTEITKADFANFVEADWLADNEALCDVVRTICELLEKQDIRCMTQASNFVSNQKYLEREVISDENLDLVLTVLTKILGTNIVETVYPYFLEFGLDKVKAMGYDITFINGLYTSNLLVEDIRTIFDIVKIALDFGALEIYKTRKIGTIDLSYVEKALEAVDKLNILNVARPEWFTLALNQVYKILSIDDEVTVDEFVGLDTDNEIKTLINIVKYADQLMSDLNLKTYKDILTFISKSSYLDQKYMTNKVFDHIIGVLEEVSNLSLVEVALPTVASWGIKQINISGLEFFTEALTNKVFTSAELIADIKNVVGILKDGIDFGVADIITDTKLTTIESSYLEDIVERIANLNVYTKLKAEWLGFGLGMALDYIGVEVSADDFDGLASDKDAFKAVVRALCEVAENLDIRCMSNVKAFINNEKYLERTTYTDANLALVESILSNLVGTNIVKAIFPKLLDYAINMAKNMNIDVSFISGLYTNDYLVEDISTLVRIVKNALDLGALNVIKGENIEDVDFTYIKAIVAELENLHLFTVARAEWVSLGLNYVTPMMNFEVSASDFSKLTESEWKEDNLTLQEIVMLLEKALDEMNYKSYKDLYNAFVRFEIKDNLGTLSDNVFDILGEVIENVASLNTLDVIFPNILSFGIDKADESGLDLEFLNGQMTLEHLKLDAMHLTNIAKAAYKFGLNSLLGGNKFATIDVNYIETILAEIGQLETFKINEAEWTAAVINFGVTFAGLDISVSSSDFAGIDWDAENAILRDVVKNAGTTLEMANATKVSNLKKLINRLFVGKFNNELLEISTLEQLIKTVDSLVYSQIVEAMLPILSEFGLNKVSNMGYDLGFLDDSVTKEQLAEDLHTILDAAKDLARFNIAKVVIKNADINYDDMSLVYNAIEKLLSLNIFVDNGNKLVEFAFNKLNINTDCLDNGTIIIKNEAESINAIVKEIVDYAKSQKANDIPGLMDLFTSFINTPFAENYSKFDDVAEPVANILSIIAHDEMFRIIGFTVIEHFAPDYEGLTDLHNIYPDYNYFSNDLIDIARAIRSAGNMRIMSAVEGKIDYPYTNKLNIGIIIRNILKLNYFNLDGRMADILDALDTLYPTVGFDQINGNNIDLASDADKIVEMYSAFARIAGRADFPIKNRHDEIKLDIKYFFNQPIFEEEMNIVETYMKTTLYAETGPLILLVLVPVLKNAAPDYWDALELDSYDINMINNDVPLLKDIFEIVMKNNPAAVANGVLDFTDLDTDINAIISDLTQLELLDGHMTALVELLLRDFVYGKKIGNIIIEPNTFDVTSIDFKADASVLQQIIVKVFEAMKAENIGTLSALRKYIENFDYVQTIKNQTVVEIASQIIELASTMTMVKANIKQVYMEIVVDLLEDNDLLQYVDYRNATNDEMIADLLVIASIIKEASTLGIGEVLDGGDINYNQASTVQNILTLVGTLNYIKYNANTLIEKLGDYVESVVAYGASYDTLDIANDLELLGRAYAEVAYLLDTKFVYRNINDLKAMDVDTVVNFVYENISIIANAVDHLALMSIAPYFLPTVVEKGMENLPQQIANALSVIDPYSLTISELAHDTLIIAELLHCAVDTNIFTYLRFKSAELPSATPINEMIQKVYEMYLLDGHYTETIISILDAGKVNTSKIDLSKVDYDNEISLLQAIITEIMAMVNEYGIKRYEDVKPELEAYKTLLESHDNEALARRIRDALNRINLEHLVNIVEILDESTLIDQLVIPMYNLVYDKAMPERFKQYLDITGYETSDVENDMHLFASGLRSLYESGIHKEILNNVHVGDECVPHLQDAVRYFAQLRILDMKKQDLVCLVGELSSEDLSDLDISSVDLTYDAEIIINVIDEIYKAYSGTNRGQMYFSMFGDTETMTAIIDVYAALLDTKLMRIVLPFVAHKVIPNVPAFDATFKNQILGLCDDSVDALYALLAMGAFSNNGIDFTDKALTDRVFNVIYRNFTLGEYQKYFDRFVANAYVYGVIPLNHATLSNEHEINAIRSIENAIKSFSDNYSSKLKSIDASLFKDAKFEDDVINLFKTLLQSDFISQIFMSVMNGTSQVLTEGCGKIAFFEGMTNDEFVDVALPEVFDIIGYALELRNPSNDEIDYKNTQAISKLVHAIVDSTVIGPHIDELLVAILKSGLQINISKQELTDANIDYAQEANYLDGFLSKIDAQLQVVDLKDKDAVLSNAFLKDASQAARELVDSKVLKIIIKPLMRKVIDQVGTTNDMFNFMTKALNDASYTSDDAMEDYVKVLNIIDEAVEINFFGTIDYANISGHISILLDNLFSMNAVKGSEEEVMRTILDKLTFVDTKDIDLSKVTDWDEEFDSFTKMIESLAVVLADDDFDINNVTAETLKVRSVQAKFVDYVDKASKSYVGRELFKKIYASKIYGYLSEDLQAITNFDEIDPSKWAKEVEEMFELYNLVDAKDFGAQNIKAAQALDVYDILFGLNGKDGIEGIKNDKKRWLEKFVAYIPKAGNGSFSVDMGLIDDTNIDAEIMNIRAIIVELSTYINNPEIDPITSVDYLDIINSTDYEKLGKTLITLGNSIVMRNILLGMIGDSIITNSDSFALFNLKKLASDYFWYQYDNKAFDEDFWDDEEFMTLAILIACSNAFNIKDNCDITTMKLGTEYPNVNEYYNVRGGNTSSTEAFPSQTAGSSKVGLRQFLQLINISKVFDLSSFDGENGIIAQLFKQKGIITPSRSFGKVANWDEEIIDLTDVIATLRDKSLLGNNANISQAMREMNSKDLESFLRQLIKSDIIRPTVAGYVHSAIVVGIVNVSMGVVNEDAAKNVIENKYIWLHEQASVEFPLDTEEGYNSQISRIVAIMNDPSSLLH